MDHIRNRNILDREAILASVLADTRSKDEIFSSIKQRICERSDKHMTDGEAIEAAFRLIRYFEALVEKPRADLGEK